MGNGTPHLPFIGEIDEGQVWDYVISEDQIQSSMISELSGLEEGLLAYWNFNQENGPTLYDLSGDNNGTINGATWSGDGAPVQPPVYGCTDQLAENYNSEAVSDDGSCYYPQDDNFSLSFDGDVNSVDIDVSISGDYTVSGWFNYETANTGNAIVGSSSNDYVRIVPGLDDDSQRFLGYNSPTGANHKGQIPLEANRWYHFAVTRSGDELSFFINGEFDGSFYEPSTDLDWVKIGIHRNGWQHGFHGGLDDITIWDKHLEDAHIREIMNLDSLWNKKDNELLKANYRFNAGGGDILFDHSGNANHGQINGATWDGGFVLPPSSVTFLVNMRNYEGMELENGENYNGDLSEGVFLAGGNIGWMADSTDDQTGFQMSDDDGDLIYEVTIDLEKNSFYYYKFRIGLTDGNWQGNWESISECGYGEYSDRFVHTSNEMNQIVGPYCFSSCENCKVPNMSLSFDGIDDIVDIGGPVLNQNTKFSITSWFKVNDFSSENYLLNHGNGGEIKIFIHNNDLIVWFKTTNGYLDQITAPISLNEWHHYAVTYDNNNVIKLFLDGSDQGTRTIGDITLYSSGGNLTFGMSNNGDGNFFSGNLDDIAIWDIVLDQEQISTIMHSSLTGYENGIIGYWDFDSGENFTLYDYSGNGNHGEISGATWDNDFLCLLILGLSGSYLGMAQKVIMDQSNIHLILLTSNK